MKAVSSLKGKIIDGSCPKCVSSMKIRDGDLSLSPFGSMQVKCPICGAYGNVEKDLIKRARKITEAEESEFRKLRSSVVRKRLIVGLFVASVAAVVLLASFTGS